MLPIVFAVFLAFHKLKILGKLNFKWISGQNFLCLANDERVWIALKNTAEYVAIGVPVQTLLALVLATILDAHIKGKNWFRIILFLPTVTFSAVLTLIFIMWMLNSNVQYSVRIYRVAGLQLDRQSRCSA